MKLNLSKYVPKLIIHCLPKEIEVDVHMKVGSGVVEVAKYRYHSYADPIDVEIELPAWMEGGLPNYEVEVTLVNVIRKGSDWWQSLESIGIYNWETHFKYNEGAERTTTVVGQPNGKPKVNTRREAPHLKMEQKSKFNALLKDTVEMINRRVESIEEEQHIIDKLSNAKADY